RAWAVVDDRSDCIGRGQEYSDAVSVFRAIERSAFEFGSPVSFNPSTNKVPSCSEYFCCKVILRPNGGAQMYAPPQNGVLPATCRARLRRGQIFDTRKSDKKLIGCNFGVLTEFDQCVEGEGNVCLCRFDLRRIRRGPSL